MNIKDWQKKRLNTDQEQKSLVVTVNMPVKSTMDLIKNEINLKRLLNRTSLV